MSAQTEAPTMATAPPVLRVEGLGKAFTLHLRDGLVLSVLDQVSLQVDAGECVALVGASGRGKSTLLKCLFGSYGVDRGAMWLHTGASAIDLALATPQQWLALRRRTLSHVSQFLRVLPRIGALDIVADRLLQAQETPAGAPAEDEPRRLAEARATAAELLARLNLPPALWSLPPATFSGGEQQRVNIARGLVQPARLLLLDEPTASLDAANRRVVVALINEAKARGTAVLGVFHDEEVRDAVANRCVRLDAQETA